MRMRIFFFILLLNGCKSVVKVKTVEKGEILMKGPFRGDVPEGKISFFNREGILLSLRTFQDGVLNGEFLVFHPNGRIASQVNFENGKENGFKLVWDINGNLIYKNNFYYGKAIGPVYNFKKDTTEFSFNNFENRILYYSSVSNDMRHFEYPSISYLIWANAEIVEKNGEDFSQIFLYLISPPKLKLKYSIGYINDQDSIINQREIRDTIFFHEDFYSIRNDLKIAVILNCYDSLTQKEEVIIKYLEN